MSATVYKEKKHPNPALHILRAVLGLAACAAFIICFAIPFHSYMLAQKTEKSGEHVAAAEMYGELGGFLDSAAQRDNCLLEAAGEYANSGDFSLSRELYDDISNMRSERADEFRAAVLAAGGKLLAREDWQHAFECYGILLGDGVSDISAELESCQSGCYDALCEKYESGGKVPEGFSQPLLDGYKDAAQYRTLYELERCNWTDDYDKAVELLYELGDFKGLRDGGFITQRLLSREWRSENGYYYFSTDAVGEPDYNLPGYRYSGYYGLYCRFNGCVMSIGSDEKQFWREQFRFTFSEHDSKLDVYSFASTNTYTLYRQP